MARPSKLSPELTAQIADLIRAGNYAEVAAAAAGISKSTFYRWLQQGEDPDAPTEFREFRDAIKRAEAEAEGDALEVILSAAQGGKWQASAWYLERRHPDRWRNRTANYSPTPSPGDRDPIAGMHDELLRLRELREQELEG